MSSRFVPGLIALCALLVIAPPGLQSLALSQPGREALHVQALFGLCALAALVALVISPFVIPVPRLRTFALGSLAASAAVLLSLYLGSNLGSRVRMAAFQRLAERSASLVQAVRSYEVQHGTPPPDLAALVPKFLPAIPGTGLAAYPSYEYLAGEKAARFDGNPWVLVVSTPSGGINFDTFMYFPLQNYPETGYGGSLERVLDWAYVHE